MDCGCEQRAHWLSVKLTKLAGRFETRPTLALMQLLTILGLAAAAGYGASRSRSYAIRARSA